MKRFLFWFLPGVIILIADRILKVATDGADYVLADGLFAIHSVQNTGAAMGLFSGNTLLVLVFSFLMIVAAIWLLKGMKISGLAPFSLSLIAGGALGNIIDRIAYGYVKDMIEVLFIDFYIFNLADVGVVCGVVLCTFSLLFRPQDWRKK